MPILAIAALAAVSAPCTGNNTIEVDQCLASQLAADQSALDRYLAAARKRLAAENPSTVALVDKAQAAWRAYRDQNCAAVYDFWSEGTIRGSMELTCRRQLTRARTHDVWRDWLTYADSTPPLLPEPPAGG